MTTHVFIVNDTTFKYHLEYLFAGTGASRITNIDFNNQSKTSFKSQTEINLVKMMADGCRIRKDDFIIFYLEQCIAKHEGMFFGIFQAVEDGIFLDNNRNNQFLLTTLEKSLTFRLKIRPYEVYPSGVTEWEALDEIKAIQSPCQMLWSLIYRKLKGHRGNTMITIYEAERLINLIRTKNNYTKITCGLNDYFTYNENLQEIVKTPEKHSYTGSSTLINIVPRFIQKYSIKLAHEAHLQMYITQNIGLGTNKSLDKIFSVNRDNLEWLGNEVSCGVGMQRIDIMFSKNKSIVERILYTVELKAEYAKPDNTKQILKYLKWVEQYYIPNRPSIIQPVLICKGGKALPKNVSNDLKKFNKESGALPLMYVEYLVDNNEQIIFKGINY